jgi:hypothetical protein
MIGLNRMLRLRHNVLFFSCTHNMVNLFTASALPNCYICIAIYSANLFACHLRVTGGMPVRFEKTWMVNLVRIVSAHISVTHIQSTTSKLITCFASTDLARKLSFHLFFCPRPAGRVQQPPRPSRFRSDRSLKNFFFSFFIYFNPALNFGRVRRVPPPLNLPCRISRIR